jgi:hypothetical protein
MSPERYALLGVLVLFFLYLVWRFLQVRSGRRRHPVAALAPVRAKVKEARAAQEPAQRALRFVEAGDIARTDLHDAGLAVAYYLRALRADPGSAPAIDALRASLSEPAGARRLERLYWRLLSRVPAQGPTRTAWLAVWRALGELYAKGYRSPVRARAIRTLLEELEGKGK